MHTQIRNLYSGLGSTHIQWLHFYPAPRLQRYKTGVVSLVSLDDIAW